MNVLSRADGRQLELRFFVPQAAAVQSEYEAMMLELTTLRRLCLRGLQDYEWQALSYRFRLYGLWRKIEVCQMFLDDAAYRHRLEALNAEYIRIEGCLERLQAERDQRLRQAYLEQRVAAIEEMMI